MITTRPPTADSAFRLVRPTRDHLTSADEGAGPAPSPPRRPRRSSRRAEGRVPGARSPLTSGGLALILTSGITSVLGLPYWVIAARRYSPAEVGTGSALVSAMLLLSSIATAGLKRSLIRFVPEAGAGARRLVARTYAFAFAAGCAAAVVFVAGVGVWAPDLGVLHEQAVLAVAFVLGVGMWGLFQLQDSVLVALRRAWVVPLKNVGFSVAKIGLLVGLAAVVPAAGVYLSWAIPASAAMVVASVWLRRAAVAPPSVEGTELASRWEMTRFAGAEHVASLLWHATMHLTPLVVLAILGAAQNASYYVAAQIGYSLYLVSSNVGDVLVAEGAIERRHLHRSLRKAAVQVGVFLVPGVLVFVVGAPWILSAFGAGYRDDATDLLRLLALSALPNTVVSLLVSVAQVRRRMRRVMGIYGAIFVATLAASWVALGSWGLTGVGWVWLVVQTGAAVVLAYVTARDEPELVRAVADVALVAAGRVMARSRGRRSRHRLPAGLARVPDDVRGDHGWTLVTAQDDRVVLRRDDDAQVMRGATGLRGVDAVVAHTVGLRSLHADERLGATRWLIPELVAAADDGTWMVETTCDGTPGSLLPPEAQPTALDAAVTAVDRLHEACAELTVVDDQVLTQWVDAPGRVVARSLVDPQAVARLEEVLDGLRSALRGRTVVASRVHGNLSLDEVLFSDDGHVVTGIVDWEATTTALPELDIWHLIVTERQRTAGGEWGTHVAALVDGGPNPVERRLRARTWPANLDLPEPVLVQLTWLHHVSSHLLKSRPDLTHGWWLRRNVEGVLAHLVPEPAPALVRAGTGGRRLRSADGRAGLLRTPAPAAVTLGLAALAGAAWVVGLWGADPGAMTDLGLLSLLTPANGVALAVLLVAFGIEVARSRPATWRLATPVVLFVAAIHGTPAVVYGTLRYAWAWKHLGIVDYIDRYGAVDPQAEALGVYHNWPGFFSQIAAVLDLMGVEEPFRILRWWPLAIELVTIPALLFVFSAFSSDRRVRWTAVLLFMVANWVGQDYFSPQSEAFVLYLALIGLVLHRFPRPPVKVRWWERAVERAEPATWSPRWTGAVLVLLAAAIVSSHQITPFMTAVALGALWVTRRVRSGWALAATVALAGVWVATGARTFVVDNLRDLTSSVGQPVGNAGANLVDTAQLSAHQQLVSTMGRVTVAGVALAVGVAVLRQLRGRRLRVEALVLAASPVAMVLTNNFDGEIIFRTYLFALPFLAWLAADGIWGGRDVALTDRRRTVRAVVGGVVAAALLCGFLFGYYGKDQWYRFSEDEIAASAAVLTAAPPGTLLVTGTDNYPVQFMGYEDLTYVPIAAEPVDSRQQVLDDPATVLAEWLADERYRAGYVLITRSQRAEADATGILPPGALARLEDDLRGSPLFTTVFDTPDATVFTLRMGDP